MTHTGKSAGHHNDNNDKDVMGYALPRRENESVQVGLAVRDKGGMSVRWGTWWHHRTYGVHRRWCGADGGTGGWPSVGHRELQHAGLRCAELGAAQG
jgi:hypothetical protein